MIMDISELCVFWNLQLHTVELGSQLQQIYIFRSAVISCCCYCLSGGRYIVQDGGLQFLNVIDSDAGNYTCRAEVDEFGNYAERFISVAVNSASFSVLLADRTIGRAFGTVSRLSVVCLSVVCL